MTRAGGHAKRSAATIDTLLDAAGRILTAEGAAGVSVQRVADAAGRSKGLVHYHFEGKDALLAACAHRLTAHLTRLDQTGLARSTAATALDELWAARAAALRDGTHPALLALASESSPATRAAMAASHTARRAAARDVVDTLAGLLAFAPQVPRAAVAEAYVALSDGIALAYAVRPGDAHRAAFDAFWLAVLSMGG